MSELAKLSNRLKRKVEEIMLSNLEETALKLTCNAVQDRDPVNIYILLHSFEPVFFTSPHNNDPVEEHYSTLMSHLRNSNNSIVSKIDYLILFLEKFRVIKRIDEVMFQIINPEGSCNDLSGKRNLSHPYRQMIEKLRNLQEYLRGYKMTRTFLWED